MFERFIREEETDPSIGVLAKMVHKDAIAMEAGLRPPFGGPGKSLCLHQSLTKYWRHHEMSHPPATPLSQESVQPLPPSSYHTMGGGLADHELAADGSARIEPRATRDFDMFTFTSRAHAEVSQRSGVHTRFTDDGVDQASVSVVS